MYALSIGAVSQIIASGMVRHSQSRRIERHAEAFVRKHKLPQDLAVQVTRPLPSTRHWGEGRKGGRRVTHCILLLGGRREGGEGGGGLQRTS